MTPAGFPHSDIPGSTRICRYPRLFAAYHVLHRLLVPRHPPCALSSLTGHPSVLVALLPVSLIRLSKTRSRPSRVAGSRRAWRGLRATLVGRSADPPAPAARGCLDAAHLFSMLAGGDSGSRTRNLRLAKPALCQLSYIPGREAWLDDPRRADRSAGRWWA
jgi:hypothetical protein